MAQGSVLTIARSGRSHRQQPHALNTRQGRYHPASTAYGQAIDLAIGARADGPVFLAADGRRLDRHAAGRIVRKTARRAGLS